MACNGVLIPQKKYAPLTTVTPPVLKIFNPPVLKLFTRLLPTGNKKHKCVKLMHKPLIQHNCQQIKEQNEV